MTKTLSVVIKDTANDGELTILGTLDETIFNPVIVIKLSAPGLQVDSQSLAKALAEIVKFQTPAPPQKPLTETYGV